MTSRTLGSQPGRPWGDVAAPVNRTKGPVCAGDQGGILHGNEIVKELNLIASFVLTGLHSDLLLQIWQ